MSHLVTVAVQQASGRGSVMAHYVRALWTVAGAVVAVVAGISTLNMAVADAGLATLNEFAAPVMAQMARMGRQA
jgi:hypothetical protein